METEAKTADVVQVPEKRRSGAWSVARRIIKYAIQCALLVAMLIAVVSWYRSYHAKSDLLIPHIPGVQKSCFVGSDRGTIYTGFFNDSPYPYPIASKSRLSQFEIEDHRHSPGSDVKQTPFQFGKFFAMRLIGDVNYDSRSKQYVSAVQQLKGNGIYFPHCLVVIVLGTLFVLFTFGRRFTLRGLMIWITVVCLLMGIQIAAANYPTVARVGE